MAPALLSAYSIMNIAPPGRKRFFRRRSGGAPAAHSNHPCKKASRVLRST